MSSILSIPLLKFPLVTGNNETLLDAFAFYDVGNVPIDLGGIDFRSIWRKTETSMLSVIDAMTANGTMLVGGASFNVLSYNIPESTMRAVKPGAYFADVIGWADGVVRRVAVIEATVEQGFSWKPDA